MHSRILYYKNKINNYDILNQFIVKSYKQIPNFHTCEVQIKNTQLSDTKQLCLNLITIQLIGCISTEHFLNKNKAKLKLKLTGNNCYFFLENLLLLTHKNKLKSAKMSKTTSSKIVAVVSYKDSLSVLEYFSPCSNFIRLTEKIVPKDSYINIICELTSEKSKNLNVYFLKSLGYPF